MQGQKYQYGCAAAVLKSRLSAIVHLKRHFAKLSCADHFKVFAQPWGPALSLAGAQVCMLAKSLPDSVKAFLARLRGAQGWTWRDVKAQGEYDGDQGQRLGWHIQAIRVQSTYTHADPSPQGIKWPTLTVSRVSLRVCGGRRSGGTLMRRVDMAVTRVSGTGSTCISAEPSFCAGAGFTPGPA